MKKYLLLSAVFLFSVKISNSQLPNQNTYLLKNINTYASYAALWGYTAPNGREYAILGTQTGTSFVDITDSANIHEVDFVGGLSSSWREMKVYSHYAYVVSEAANSRLQIMDLQYLPDSVSLVNTWSYSGYTHTHSISQSGHYLYLNGGNAAANGGIAVVDLTNPVNPTRLGLWTTDYVHDCRILNDTIWAANIYSGKISIINAANKNSLITIRSFQEYPVATVSTHNCAITTDRRFVLATNEVSSPPGQLSTYNIEDLNNITFVNNWQPTGITTAIVHNVEIYGDYAVIAHYTAGIRIVNISDPTNPVEVAWYDTYPTTNTNSFNGCWAVYKFASGKIIGSDISNGLFVIKTNIADINNPPVKLNLKVFPEGFYDSLTTHLSRKDSVKVILRNNTLPYSIVDSSKAAIDSINYTGTFKFSNAPTGTYYIVVKHLNSIETWSRAGGEPLVKEGATYYYDFTTSSSKAYGNNLSIRSGKYCMFSGDINQSSIIDLADIIAAYNDATSFVAGVRLPTDVNGDNVVNLADMIICYNNSNNFVSVIRP